MKLENAKYCEEGNRKREGEQERIFKRAGGKRWQIKGRKLIPQDTAHPNNLQQPSTHHYCARKQCPWVLQMFTLLRIIKHC